MIFLREVRAVGTAEAVNQAVRSMTDGLLEYGKGRPSQVLEQNLPDICVDLAAYASKGAKRFSLSVRLEVEEP